MGKIQPITGLHAAREAILRGNVEIREVWLKEGKKGVRIEEIQQISVERGIPVQFKKGVLLDQFSPGGTHQGIVAFASAFKYLDLDEMLKIALGTPGQALLIAADHITDEGNLGALIRTAAFFGAQGLILPKDRSAQMTERVFNRSAGSYVFIPVARVVNLGRTLDTLKKKGLWIIGADGEGSETLYEFDWIRPLILVLGSEGRGLSPSIKKRCHQQVRVPSQGDVSSLNVSVAGGVILSEIIRQRKKGGNQHEGNGKPL